jgi:hypothetical protein
VVAVALRPATAEPAAAEQLDGLRFPHPAGWRGAGARTDQVAGRAIRTVFYERDGARVAYTIVSGAPLDGAGRRWLRHEERAALVWIRGGHTCVVSGRVDRAVLASVSAWR